ncbi:hypothetical protein PE36_00245 [Moritella sp. PE36]|nr:hypothetical protein [Moritella sp. PE36]EDM66180.1 hypothetical protein PE36_00245 [Moritella sp. PE36]
MTNLEKAQNLMNRAISMMKINPAFAERLFESAKMELIKCK